MENKWFLIIGIAILFALLYNLFFILFFIHIDTKEEIKCIKDLANKNCNGKLKDIEIVVDAPTKSTYLCEGDKKSLYDSFNRLTFEGDERFFNKQELEECYKK